MDKRKGDWIQTYSGIKFYPLDPRPEEVNIQDIAHSLSMMCRYAGHSLRFYSVAEHCCHIYDYLKRPAVKRWGLLHDASEAFLVDVPRPIKSYLSGYKEAERSVMLAVAQAFGLNPDEPAEVKEADCRILVDEMDQNMFLGSKILGDELQPLGVKLEYWEPEQGKKEFLKRFWESEGVV